ncbi:MAG: tyrosine-type recombinase/integrase [Burkholderiales bacterium]|nr:tyrosine-type recombinase/integrase [Burkholderiales bacterium]
MKRNEYSSVLAPELRQYLDYRVSLGYSQSIDTDCQYGDLDKFLQEKGLKLKGISKELADSWCRRRTYEAPGNQHRRICLLRGFCRYLRSRGYAAHIPGRLAVKVQKYEAHVFSDEELRKFFHAVDHPHFSNAATRNRDAMLPLFFRILYTSGMRAGELAKVLVGDIDIEKATVTVHMGKNRNDRIVPIHPSLAVRCRTVMALLPQPLSKSDYFFQITEGKASTRRYYYEQFRKALKQAGISHLGRGKGPRMQDLRHTYCVNLLQRWINEGRNLQAWLPYLQTILGHVDFRETAYYLKVTARSVPQRRDCIESKFPNIFEDNNYDEPEFY